MIRRPPGLKSTATPVPTRRSADLPVALATQEPHHHQLRGGDHLLDVEVDRHIVAELHEVGEAQAGCGLAERGSNLSLGGGERGQLAVRGREEDDVAGVLPEVDRFRAVPEIGRASWRERGGKDLEVLVVAGSYK